MEINEKNLHGKAVRLFLLEYATPQMIQNLFRDLEKSGNLMELSKGTKRYGKVYFTTDADVRVEWWKP